MGAVNAVAWLRYSGREPLRRHERVLQGLTLALGTLALVPGALLGSVVHRHPSSWTHTDDAFVTPTALGGVAFALMFAVVTIPFARYLARWRAGETGAGAHALAVAGLSVAGAIEALDSLWLQAWPHFSPVGLTLTLVAVGWSVSRRFVDSACELEALSARLDAKVAAREGELASVQKSLEHYEKLAVLGRLSGAVAHEINNPAAAVAANLGYMRDALKSDGDVAGLTDAAEVIKETLESVDRIARIVRQLGDAGELAIRGSTSDAVPLVETVRRAAADAHADLHDEITLEIAVPEDVYVRTQENSLRQVVTSLISTAARAMRAAPCTGRIRVEAERQGEGVALRIIDPLPEADDVLRARRFDPFLSARPTSVARGVGLSVSVVLLRVFGGDMTLERSDEDGSVVRIDLRSAEAPPHKAEIADSTRAPRARVLLVDDDVLVRIGLRRLLGREYVLDEAGTVEEALACVAAHAEDLDAIVCDLVMPDGGAGRVLEELARVAPRLAAATILMTGGAVDLSTQTVLDANADRVLRKPVDVSSLRALIERVRRRRSGMGRAAPGTG